MAVLDPALRPLRRYADFSGRSTRTELMSFLFLIVIVQVAAAVVAMVVDGRFARLAGAAVALAFLCPWLAVLVRRLHDQGKSGWWLLALLLLGGGAGASFDPRRFEPWMLVPIAAGIAFWTIALWKGDEGENRYGPNPRTDQGPHDR